MDRDTLNTSPELLHQLQGRSADSVFELAALVIHTNDGRLIAALSRALADMPAWQASDAAVLLADHDAGRDVDV